MLFVNFVNYLDARLNAFVGKKYYAFIISIFCYVACLLFNFSNYESGIPYLKNEKECGIGIFEKNIENCYAATIQQKIDHPFKTITAKASSHEAKLSLRLSIPVMANLLHLNVFELFIIQNLLGVLFFYLSFQLVFRISENLTFAIFTTLSFAFIYIGRSFIIDLNPWFDGYPFIAILLCMVIGNPVALFFLSFFSMFCDERALIIMPLVIVWNILVKDTGFTLRNLLLSRSTIVLISSMMLYLIVRQSVSYIYDLSTPREGISHLIFFQNYFEIYFFLLVLMQTFFCMLI